MPTYEYACKSCGHRFEINQRFTDEPLTACPQCDGQLRKVFGNVGITFKGSGFYKTDSRSTSKSSSSSPSSDSGSGSSDSGSKTSGDAGSKTSGDAGSKSSGDSTPSAAAS